MTPNRIAFALALLLLAGTGVVVLVGTPEPAITPPAPIPTTPPLPDTPWPHAELPPGDALASAVLTPGEGDLATRGQLVEVSTTLWLEATAREVGTTTRERFLLGADDRIDGLVQTLEAMRPGETRLARIPPESAYGQTGKRPAIPPDATLMARITLHAAEDARAPSPSPPAVALDQTDGTLRYAVLAPGVPEVGSTAPLQVHLTTWRDGLLLSSTLSDGRPLTVRPVTTELDPAMERAMLTLRPGERRLVRVPGVADGSPADDGPDGVMRGVVVEIERVAPGANQ
jgi:FKBP-type peptidyl-prolyl cis-trans isomerase 2